MLNDVLTRDGGTSFAFEAADGVPLHARLWEPRGSRDRLPVVCLAGLTRSSLDFVPLASALASGAAPRRIVAPDYRGRGASGYDPAGRYDIATERDDLLRLLDALKISSAHFIGTSRGGLHVMMLAEAHAARLTSVVLNDIGPILEPAGLIRIKGYIGRAAKPRSLDEAVRSMKLSDAAIGFDGLDAEEWRHFARTTFGFDEHDLRLRYDPRLAEALDDLDPTRPLPDFWSAFDRMRPAPVLTIRGANSDLLSTRTLDAMSARWLGNKSYVVRGQAHAPLLADPPTLAVIADFLDEADRARAGPA